MPAATSSAALVARHLTVAHGPALVLDDVNLTVGPGSRVGVVGPNGAGKTTLLRALAGLQPPDSGSVVRMPPAATAGYLAQEPELVAGETLVDQLARRTGVAAARQELDATAVALAGEAAGPGSAATDDYAEALERYLALGAPDFEARAAATCEDLGLTPAVLEADTATLSGGQLARASLAAVLLARFDIFLLDEPTNDLDFAGLDRLERFVDGLAGALVVVSHDRAFLERAVSSVLELDEASHRVQEYRGGWAAYRQARATARGHAEEAFSSYRLEHDRLTERGRRQRQWAVSGATKARRAPRDNDKAQRGWKVDRTEKQAAKVRSTERALERLTLVEKPWEGWQLHLTIAAAPRSGEVVARLQGAVVARGAFRLGPLDLEVRWGERLAVVGPNGAGKTTLLQVLLGRVQLAAGTRWVGPGVVVGELDQRRSRFLGPAGEGRESLLDGFTAATGLAVAEARSLLAKLGLGASDVVRAAATLSPGERTRAGLALLMAGGVNCLVLDEPTNHLDLEAIEQLEAALSSWTGTLVLVTHDRRLLERVELSRLLDLGHPDASVPAGQPGAGGG